MRAFRTAMKLDETSVAALTGQTTIVSGEMSLTSEPTLQNILFVI